MTRDRGIDTVAIIQARMNSTRLPGKVMAEINGRPMLYHVVTRAQRTRTISRITVATTQHRDDDAVETFCYDHGIRCFRGSPDDVLDRYYRAAQHCDASVIVRLTADCPLLDPGVIEKVTERFYRGTFDYVSNTLVCTYPDGLDTEVFSFAALEQAWRESKRTLEREHVTPYMRNHPELFRLGNVRHTRDISHLRWTVDEPRDMDFVRSVFAVLGNSDFGMREVLALLERNPDLAGRNAGIGRNEGYLKSLREDRPVSPGGAA